MKILSNIKTRITTVASKAKENSKKAAVAVIALVGLSTSGSAMDFNDTQCNFFQDKVVEYTVLVKEAKNETHKKHDKYTLDHYKKMVKECETK